MADQDFLSQEEIDALLGNTGGGGEEESPEVEEKSDVHPFDFNELENVKKGGLPGLDLIYERWVKYFRDEIRKKIPKINMVSKENIYITRFNSFMFKIPMPSSYTTFTMKPLKETALFVMDARLVSTMISIMFGGLAKPFKIEGREFTKLELHIIKDFIDIALKTLEDIFSNVISLNIEKKSTELNPSLAKITTGNEKVIIAECIVDLDGYEAPIYFCYPQGMFIPIRDVIYTEFSGEVDAVWKDELKKSLLETPVTVTLELVKKEYLMKEVLSWNRGTKLILDVSKEDRVKLLVGGQEKFECRLGKSRNKYAALLKEELQEEEEDE